MSSRHHQPKPNKTDVGNGSKSICRVSNVLRSPSPDPRRSAEKMSCAEPYGVAHQAIWQKQNNAERSPGETFRSFS